MDLTGKWGISHDEETFCGEYDTADAALAECDPGDGDVWIGQYDQPTDPAAYIDADLVLEHITCQDEYSMDCAEGAFDRTKADEDDLTESLRKAFREWMERTGCAPGFWIVNTDSLRHVTREQLQFLIDNPDPTKTVV